MERSTNIVAAPVSHQMAHAMVQSAKRGLLMAISILIKPLIFRVSCITQHR
jgi:hypothetical protein